VIQSCRAGGRFGKHGGPFGFGCWLGVALYAAAISVAAQEQGSVTLAWDPSPSSGISEYRLYVGPATRTYTNCIAVGNLTTTRVTNLVVGATYFFAVTACDASKAESDFSNEISYTVPLPPNNGPAQPPSTNAPRVMIQVQNVSTGPVVLSGTGQAGETYRVLCSEDWRVWNVIGVVTVNSNGEFSFTDPAGTSRPSRFYRLQAVMPPKVQINAPVGEAVILKGTGESGQSYSVLSSQDLKTWAAIGTVTASATGSLVFTDTFAHSQPGRFYRLRCP